ncbi:VOC family protein [Paenibacillus spiritus]|uniref:VOC family protein n=1 Tax=Paenibacillus spiritus TaxID=2496557 RepID=A0A5J5G5N9_9BACL|nr:MULTISPECIES: VOC family protein [Paenibacillus]KAA9002432.1 VOC family protein [Paenibacillus spiritus]
MSIRLNPYFVFNGNTREALDFYAKALRGNVVGIMTFGDMPENPSHPLTDEMKNLVMHAQLKVGDTDLMFSDTFPGTAHQAEGDTVQIAIHPSEEAEAWEIFNALADGGQVVMPLQKTDWSPLYGIVKDRFGVTFQVNVPGEE